MTAANVEVWYKDGVKPKSKPDAIIGYILNKSGVDRNDQMISYYPMKRKQSCERNFFYQVFVMAVVNAYIL